MDQKNLIKDGAIKGLIFILLLIITLYIPLINLVTVFLLPIPFVLFTKTHGWRAGVMLFVVLAMVCTILLTYVSIPFVLLIALGGIAIGQAMHKERSPYETWAIGTAGFAIGFGILYAVTQFIFQINWMEELYQGIEESFRSSAGIFQAFQVELDEAAIEQAKEQARSFVYLIPTGMIISSIVSAFVAQWFSYKWLNRNEGTNYRFPKFRNLSFPTSLIWYYLFAIILTWMFTDPADPLYLAGVNLYSLIGMLLLIQGLSFVFFYTHHKGWSKAVPIVVIVILVLFPVFLLYPLRILGIIDLGFQLRKRLTDGPNES